MTTELAAKEATAGVIVERLNLTMWSGTNLRGGIGFEERKETSV